MKITSRTAAIESDRDSYGHAASLTANQCVNGYGVSLALLEGDFYIASCDGGLFLCGIPSAHWLQDFKDDGFTILHTIKLQPAVD